MAALEEGPSRPSIDGAGRGPVSRFQEGSMNDRTSAAPPLEFLGPEELARFERQFFPNSKGHGAGGTQRIKRNRSVSRRHDRPSSASAQLQSVPYSTLQLEGAEDASPDTTDSQELSQQPKPQPKRSNGFFGRVLDAFGFGSKAAPKAASAAPTSKVQQELEKRTSLPQPPTQPRLTVDMAKSLSQTDILQLPESFVAGGDRPLREDIMDTYNQLMANGFFKAHAIQSTRQPPPGSIASQKPHLLSPIPSPNRPTDDQVPPVPSIPASPNQLNAKTSTTRLPPPPPPPSSLFGGSDLKSKSSRESFRYPRRGKKRARTESDEGGSCLKAKSSQQLRQAHPQPSSATGHLGGLGRRASKKLRKMPSSIGLTPKGDGVVRVVSAVGDGPLTESAMRSPSPLGANRKAVSAALEERPGSSYSNRLRKTKNLGITHEGKSRPLVSLQGDGDTNGNVTDENARCGVQGWESMDVDYEDKVSSLLRDGQLGIAATPLSVVPDTNRGIPSVPSIPAQYKRNGGLWDENTRVDSGMEAQMVDAI
ncbi:hypothetical protein BX600DRAFT_430766 [Xylariales sp. PMI_506]|nr:hypothetical protein BX600DRAFT_430766 [Xylariales sp. PMI_506]